jgi:hypothetical protein
MSIFKVESDNPTWVMDGAGNALLRRFYIRNDQIAKTGSGQTQEKLKKQGAFCAGINLIPLVQASPSVSTGMLAAKNGAFKMLLVVFGCAVFFSLCRFAYHSYETQSVDQDRLGTDILWGCD